MSWVKVGAKCVCVASSDSPDASSVQQPVIGATYTIDVIVRVQDWLSLCFIEINDLHTDPDGFVWIPVFKASRFRPLVDQKTDLELFQPILDRAGRNADQRLPLYGTVIADDQTLREIEEQARGK